MRRTLLPVIALLTFGVAACGHTAAAPKASSFTEGTCRVAAPDVLALGQAAQHLGKGAKVPADVKAELKDAQDGLRTISDGAEPAYKPAFDKLVTATGFVRIRADGNTYDPSLGRDLMSSYAEVLSVCTAPGKGAQ